MVIATIDISRKLEELLEVINNALVSRSGLTIAVCHWRYTSEFQVYGRYLLRRSGSALTMIPFLQKTQFVITSCRDQIGHWVVSTTS